MWRRSVTGKSFFLANSLVLVGIVWLLALGTQENATTVLPPTATAGSTPDIAALEQRAALAPSGASVVDLASAYLDRGQPGLAFAVLDRAPEAVRAEPDAGHLAARALVALGHSEQALDEARRASAACGDPARPCPPWLAAKAARHLAFLEELVAAGVEDPARAPEATRAAFERSNRAVRLVALR
jgi:hypothetical protein